MAGTRPDTKKAPVEKLAEFWPGELSARGESRRRGYGPDLRESRQFRARLREHHEHDSDQ